MKPLGSSLVIIFETVFLVINGPSYHLHLQDCVALRAGRNWKGNESSFYMGIGFLYFMCICMYFGQNFCDKAKFRLMSGRNTF